MRVRVGGDVGEVERMGKRETGAVGRDGRVEGAMGMAGLPVDAIAYGATKANLQNVVPESNEHEVVQALHGVLSFGHNLAGILPSLAALLGFFVVFAVLAARNLRID